MGTYQPVAFIFQCPIFLPFHSVHGVLKARILKWLAIPFSSGPHSVRPLHHDPPVLGGHRAWLSFAELDKAVVRVIRLASCLWLWFPSVCPLMPSLGVSLNLWHLCLNLRTTQCVGFFCIYVCKNKFYFFLLSLVIYIY